MQTYFVRRPGIASTGSELAAALTRLRAFEDESSALNARWMHSYALREADGRIGLTCVFQADSVQTLMLHAARTRLRAEEILPVSATVFMRPFAPALVYLIRRRNFCKTPADLEKSAAFSRRIGDEEMARDVRWLRTYGVKENDGTLGTVCIYQAVDSNALRQDATRVGIPADEIIPVLGRIVFREDTLRQPISSAAVAA